MRFPWTFTHESSFCFGEVPCRGFTVSTEFSFNTHGKVDCTFQRCLLERSLYLNVRGLIGKLLNIMRTTVDGKNPAPVDVVNIPLLTRFHACWVVQYFFHQPYHYHYYYHYISTTYCPLQPFHILLPYPPNCFLAAWFSLVSSRKGHRMSKLIEVTIMASQPTPPVT